MVADPHASQAREGTDGVGSSRSGVVLREVPWSTYEALLATEDDNPGVRMTYREGWLEIMSPSGRHENIKKMLARLLEAYSDEREIELNGFGSTTFRDETTARGLEPDECYVLRDVLDSNPSRPDLAIEVAVSAWKIDRLDVYAGLGVPEVWLWRHGKLEILVLEGATYSTQPTSSLLPDLDVDLLASFATRDDQMRAVKEYRARLRG